LLKKYREKLTMQHELLFEIGTEEIPAGYIVPALAQLENTVTASMVCPALFLPPRQPLPATSCRVGPRPGASRTERKFRSLEKGGLYQNGQPPRQPSALPRTGSGLRPANTGNTQRRIFMVRTNRPAARPRTPCRTAARGDHQPHFQPCWGAGRASFARPIQWLLAVYGGKTVPFSLDTISSANTTRGHRFMAQGPFPASCYSDYVETLRTAQVMVEPQERREAVLAEITKAAQQAGGTILPDDELVDTVCNLVEKPFAICGAFEERFLALPREVLITSMREHQKYFAVDAAGNPCPTSSR
jgi:glycyl-tRNA synthetase beta chain